MRRPSKIQQHNEESLKSIKSTDSKKIIMPVHKLNEEQEETEKQQEPIGLSEEEIKVNRKITDYFKVRKNSPQQRYSPQPTPPDILQNTKEVSNKSPPSPEGRSKSVAEDGAKDEVKSLK